MSVNEFDFLLKGIIYIMRVKQIKLDIFGTKKTLLKHGR